MSALEQHPFDIERRMARRMRVESFVAVNLGRAEGTLVDISMRGARVRHTTAVGRGSQVRVSFM